MPNINNILAESIVGVIGKGWYLDKNNICWKVIDGKWIGKRSVWTFDYRVCWLEETTIDNISSFWCGIDSDYNEIFTRE